jgi:hypothetical protein
VPQHSSPFEDADRPLRREARYVIGELRWPDTSEQEAIRRTLANFPSVSEEEIRSWFREPLFRRKVTESRELAKQYAEEAAALEHPATALGYDPCEIPSEQAFGPER